MDNENHIKAKIIDPYKVIYVIPVISIDNFQSGKKKE